MISRIISRPSLIFLSRLGSTHATYDWRDDPNQNTDLNDNYMNKGFPDPSKYHFPVMIEDNLFWNYSFPSNYNPKDLTLNMR